MNQQKNIKNTDRAAPKKEFVEGLDYYFENGFMVLTAHFLLERGYCCGNICRHCPYGAEAQSKKAGKSA